MIGVRVEPHPPEALIPEQVLRILFDGSRDEHMVAFCRRGLEGEGAFPRVLHAPVSRVVEGHHLALAFCESIGATEYVFPQTFRAGFSVHPSLTVFQGGFIKGVKWGGGGEPYNATSSHVAELTCAWADLDVGRGAGDMTAGAALGAVDDLVSAGEIPSPTFTAHSGRGAYAVWLLRESDGLAPEATPENVKLWKGVKVTLTRKLGALKPDKRIHIARPLKAPGTIDTLIVAGRETKSGSVIVWKRHGVLRGGVLHDPRYSLEELADSLHVFSARTPIPAVLAVRVPVSALAVVPPVEKAGRPGTRTPFRVIVPPRHHRGRTGCQSATCARRVNEIAALINSRGAMQEGVRHSTLFHLFREYRRWWFMENAPSSAHGHEGPPPNCACARCEERRPFLREAFNHARGIVIEANYHFKPRQTDSEVRSAMKQDGPTSRARARGGEIADDLDVTDEEVRSLGLRAIVPEEERVRRDASKKRALASKRAAQAKADRLLLDGLGCAEIGRRLGWTRQRVHVRLKALIKHDLIPVDGKLLD